MAKITRKIIKKTLYLLDKFLLIFMLLSALNWTMPHMALAGRFDLPNGTWQELPLDNGKTEFLKAAEPAIPHLPLNEVGKLRNPRFTVHVRVTAYNSAPEQTDDTPCITASGLNVCERAALGVEDVVATNIKNLPFGTKIRIPELFGDKLFMVADRMHPRYHNSIDVWMPDHNQAMSFGKKWVTVEIF